MQKLIGLAVVLVAASSFCAAAGRSLHVKDFGAIGDGHTLSTIAIQKALDAAGKRGHDTAVVLDPGTYLSGALNLRANTRFIVPEGAVLLGSSRREDYPDVATRAAGVEMMWPAALLNIDGASHVAIEGKGVIDGDGKPWWDAFWTRVPAYEKRGLRWAVDYDVQRPELIRVYKADAVRIGGGLQLKRSAFWTVHICYSTNVTVDDLTIRDNNAQHNLGPSTDGVDIDSSSHILVQHVDIENNDDAIVLKAGMNADGIRVNRLTEDVTVRDITVREAIAGIVFGSDTAGGFRRINISDVKILKGVRYGIYLKSTHTRGGWTDNVSISNVSMDGVKVALMIDLNYFPAFSTPRIPPNVERDLPPGLKAIPSYWSVLTGSVRPEQGIPHFRNIRFTNIKAVRAGTAIKVNASEDAPMENFTFTNVDLAAAQAGSIRYTKNWRLDNVIVRAADGSKVEEKDMTGTIGKIASGR